MSDTRNHHGSCIDSGIIFLSMIMNRNNFQFNDVYDDTPKYKFKECNQKATYVYFKTQTKQKNSTLPVSTIMETPYDDQGNHFI